MIIEYSEIEASKDNGKGLLLSNFHDMIKKL